MSKQNDVIHDCAWGFKFQHASKEACESRIANLNKALQKVTTVLKTEISPDINGQIIWVKIPGKGIDNGLKAIVRSVLGAPTFVRAMQGMSFPHFGTKGYVRPVRGYGKPARNCLG